MLKLLAGQPDLEAPLAGKSTLNRLELSTGTPDRYKKITFWKASIDVQCAAAGVLARSVAAIATRNDPALLDIVIALLADRNDTVRFSAAAAVWQLADRGTRRE